MKKSTIFYLVVFFSYVNLFLTIKSFGQTDSVFWSLTTNGVGSATVGSVFPYDVVRGSNLVDAVPAFDASGYGTAGQNSGVNGWNEPNLDSAIRHNAFIEFKFHLNCSVRFNIVGISFTTQTNGSIVTANSSLRYSKDGITFIPIGPFPADNTADPQMYNVNLNVLQGDTISFRLYGAGINNNNRVLRILDFSVKGTVSSASLTVATSPSQNACSGIQTNISLTSSPPNASFTWTIGNVSNAINATACSTSCGISIAQTITATGSTSFVEYIVTPSLNTCPGTASTITVNVNTPPTASTVGNHTICQNQSYILAAGEATADGTVSWSENGSGSITAGSTTLTPTYTASSGDAGNTVTLTMSVSRSPCVTATANYLIIVKALPTASAGGRDTICQNSSVTVFGASATNGTISWTENGAGSITAGANTLSPTYTPAAGDAGNIVILTMTVSNSPCTSATAIFTVVVKAQPTATAGGSVTICQNSSATVVGTSSTNGTISWTENGAGSITAGANTLNPTYTAAAGDAGNTVVLTMTVSNSPCTPATATFTIVVNALPSASAGGRDTICQNSACTVTGANATNGTILWTHNGAGTLINSTSLSPTYVAAANDAGKTVSLTMTVTSNNACSPAIATAIFSVVIKALPIASAGGSDVICQNGLAIVSGASSSNGAISWTENGSGSITSGGNTLTPTYTSVAGDSAKQVILTMTVSNSPCPVDTATYFVLVNPIPRLLSSTDTSICGGQPLDYSVRATFSTDVTYSWTTFLVDSLIGNNDQADSSNNIIHDVLINLRTDTIRIAHFVITLTYTNQIECKSTATLNVTVNPSVPQPQVVDFISGQLDTLLCGGSEFQNFNVKNRIPDVVYHWSVSDPTLPVVIHDTDNVNTLISFYNGSIGDYTEIITATATSNFGLECQSLPRNIPIHVSQMAPSDTIRERKIPAVKDTINNVLFYLDNTVDGYQWGADQKTDQHPEKINGQVFQAFVPDSRYIDGGNKLDTNKYAFWVELYNKIGDDTCRTKVYYNGIYKFCPGCRTNYIPDVEDLGASVFPNPVSGLFNLSISGNIYGNINVSIINALGQVMDSKKILKTEALQVFAWQLNTLARGIYLLNIRGNNGELISVKLMVDY